MGAGASSGPDKLSENDIRNVLSNDKTFNREVFDRLKDEQGFVSRAQMLSRLEEIYRAFATNVTGTNSDMTGAKYTKMLKDSKVIDKKTFTANDAELIFAKVVQKYSFNPKVMAFDVFLNHCIGLIAEKKRTTIDDVIATLSLCSGPVMNATKSEGSRFHDDKSTYTGQYTKGGPDTRVKGDTMSELLDRSDADVRGVKRRDSVTQQNVSAMKIQAIARGRNERKEMQRIDSSAVLETATVRQILGESGSTMLRDSFLRFSPSGEMDGRTFSKMMKDSNLTGKKFSTNDADIIFAKCKKIAGAGARGITYDIFESVALGPIAEKLRIEITDVADALSHSGGPVLNATKTDNVRFHDDKTLYTGVHGKGGPDVTVNNSNAFADAVSRA